MFILFISKWKWGDFRRVGKEQSGPCVSRTLSVWSEVLWAPGVAKILGFRWNKMGRWENEASLFRSYYLTDLPALWISVGNSISCSRLFCVSSFICISGRSFFFFFSPLWHGGQVGRGEQWLGTLNAKRDSLPRWRFWTFSLDFCTYLTILLLPYIGVDFRLQLPFRRWHCLSSLLLDAVTMKDTHSALEVRVSASKSSSHIFNKAFSRLFLF